MEQLSIFDYTAAAQKKKADSQNKLRLIAEKLNGEGLNVLSLFNGISCGRVALERAKIKVNRYVSYEIDKYANQVAKSNYPDDEYNGDVTTADFTQYKGFDLVIGGSPCTYWSIAKQGREATPDGEGGRLFLHYARAVEESECKFFIYENNNSIDASIKAFISDRLGVDFIMINSALVSAQNRERCYWTNIPDVKQPKDRGILLKDILHYPIRYSRKTGISETDVIEPIGISDGKSYCITAYYSTGQNAPHTLKKHIGSMVAEPVCLQKRVFGRTHQQDGTYDRRFEAKTDGKSPTITSQEGRRFIAKPVIFSRPHGFNRGGAKAKKSPTITSTSSWVHNNHLIDVNAIPVTFDGDIPTEAKSLADGKIYLVYKVENGLIEIKDKTYPIKLNDGYCIIRKLTPIECERLQTLPDNYTRAVSDTQRYKGIGNGWTVEVIAHIFRYLKQEA